MTDQERFLDKLKEIDQAITRETFFNVLQQMLPVLSYELQILQKYVPRRKASQGEGLMWQPPVSPLKSGEIPVTMQFEFSDQFKLELEDQKKLSFLSPRLTPNSAAPLSPQMSLLDLQQPLSPVQKYDVPPENVSSIGTLPPVPAPIATPPEEDDLDLLLANAVSQPLPTAEHQLVHNSPSPSLPSSVKTFYTSAPRVDTSSTTSS